MALYEDRTSLIDAGFYHVSPFLTVTLIALAIPTNDNPYIAYAFIITLATIIGILVAKLISVLFVLGFFWRWASSVSRWMLTKGRRLYNHMLNSWFGRFTFGLMTLHIAVTSAVWIYYHVGNTLRNTIIFLQAVVRHLLDWKLLAVAIHRWVNSIVMGPLVSFMRELLLSEIEFIKRSTIRSICVIAFVSFFFYTIYIIVHWLFAPREVDPLKEIPSANVDACLAQALVPKALDDRSASDEASTAN